MLFQDFQLLKNVIQNSVSRACCIDPFQRDIVICTSVLAYLSFDFPEGPEVMQELLLAQLCDTTPD
jgi:hypothetical protein